MGRVHEAVSAPALPAARPSFIAYAIVDVSGDALQLVDVKHSRKAGREFITWHEDADNLRIRRCEVKLFQT